MKLTVQTFLTLDGVMQAPGGPGEDTSGEFTHGGCRPRCDPAVGEFVAELNGHAAASCSVAEPSTSSASHWPDQTDPEDPIATAINSLPKHVVSNSLSEADATWRAAYPRTARLLTGDVVRRFGRLRTTRRRAADPGKRPAAPDAAAARARRSLPADAFPVVLGSGRRLFNDGVLPATCAQSTSRDRSWHRHRHLRTSRSDRPRRDVASWSGGQPGTGHGPSSPPLSSPPC